jgi:hypothetical protein
MLEEAEVLRQEEAEGSIGRLKDVSGGWMK